MYLSDQDIEALLPDLAIEGDTAGLAFDPNLQVQPCSIDLRVSNVFWKPSRRRRLWRRALRLRDTAIDLRRSHIHDLDPRRDWKRVELSKGDVLTIKPNQVLMGRVYERFRIPDGHAGKIEGRSSFSRLGLSVHCTGDFINPGWDGFMPLQLVNLGPYPIRVTPYLALCQLILIKLSSTPKRTYGDPELESKYINDDGGPSLWWRDKKVRELQTSLGEVHATERMQQQVVSLVRFESAEVLERFEHHVASLKVRETENASDILEGFAKTENRRRIRDAAFIASPAVMIGGAIGSLFAPFAVWHVAIAVAVIVSVPVALAAWVRRDDGYLGSKELRELKSRPDTESG